MALHTGDISHSLFIRLDDGDQDHGRNTSSIFFSLFFVFFSPLRVLSLARSFPSVASSSQNKTRPTTMDSLFAHSPKEDDDDDVEGGGKESLSFLLLSHSRVNLVRFSLLSPVEAFFSCFCLCGYPALTHVCDTRNGNVHKKSKSSVHCFVFWYVLLSLLFVQHKVQHVNIAQHKLDEFFTFSCAAL